MLLWSWGALLSSAQILDYQVGFDSNILAIKGFFKWLLAVLPPPGRCNTSLPVLRKKYFILFFSLSTGGELWPAVTRQVTGQRRHCSQDGDCWCMLHRGQFGGWEQTSRTGVHWKRSFTKHLEMCGSSSSDDIFLEKPVCEWSLELQELFMQVISYVYCLRWTLSHRGRELSSGQGEKEGKPVSYWSEFPPCSREGNE